MNKKTDVVGVIGLILTLFTILFGDDIYKQIRGYSIFEKPNIMTEIVPPTTIFSITETYTPTPTTAILPSLTPSVIASVSAINGHSRPDTYTLQSSGEYPYCIARRFDVDPEQLLYLSGLTSPDIYYPGMVLTIPQTGEFPGNRSLARHPTPYTIASNEDDIYSVACRFGDVFPEDIAALNGLSVSSQLSVGQVLQIP